MGKHTTEIAQSYMFDAYNVTDHADSLVANARADLDGGDIAGAVAWLRQALVPAERAPSEIRSAIEYLEKLKEEGGEGG